MWAAYYAAAQAAQPQYTHYPAAAAAAVQTGAVSQVTPAGQPAPGAQYATLGHRAAAVTPQPCMFTLSVCTPVARSAIVTEMIIKMTILFRETFPAGNEIDT